MVLQVERTLLRERDSVGQHPDQLRLRQRPRERLALRLGQAPVTVSQALPAAGRVVAGSGDVERAATRALEDPNAYAGRYGAESLAKLCETHAAELEEALRAAEDEVLTLDVAASESGYSADHLRHLIVAGTVPNAGERGRPRVRRADLPRRAPHTLIGGHDPSTHAHELLSRVK